MSEEKRDRNEDFSIVHMLIRIVVSAIVLAITAFITPGFTISGMWPLIIAAVVIGVLDYLVVRLTKFEANPFGRGIIGFVISAAIIYLTGYLVRGVGVTFWGALIAALVIGVIDAIIPGKQVF
ncbi:phage holin family protein [Clostridium oryzae]|uniref:Phage holin family protein n=1 Tax=Clostridium oryzae TaxID=1450648 RepID=A0A1V4I5W9_9CLOT|nr:phage holin family protein [Clostridium oryzae]OPJ55015.1 membrane protein of unknown function [Clostridium oryzae]